MLEFGILYMLTIDIIIIHLYIHFIPSKHLLFTSKFLIVYNYITKSELNMIVLYIHMYNTFIYAKRKTGTYIYINVLCILYTKAFMNASKSKLEVKLENPNSSMYIQHIILYYGSLIFGVNYA